MRDEENLVLEDNIRKLIQQTYTPQVQPKMDRQKKLLSELISIQKQNRPANFPIPVLGGLVGVLFTMGFWTVLHIDLSQTANPGIMFGWFVMVINLVCIPLASFTIILYRRKHA